MYQIYYRSSLLYIYSKSNLEVGEFLFRGCRKERGRERKRENAVFQFLYQSFPGRPRSVLDRIGVFRWNSLSVSTITSLTKSLLYLFYREFNTFWSCTQVSPLPPTPTQLARSRARTAHRVTYFGTDNLTLRKISIEILIGSMIGNWGKEKRTFREVKGKPLLDNKSGAWKLLVSREIFSLSLSLLLFCGNKSSNIWKGREIHISLLLYYSQVKSHKEKTI